MPVLVEWVARDESPATRDKDKEMASEQQEVKVTG